MNLSFMLTVHCEFAALNRADLKLFYNERRSHSLLTLQYNSVPLSAFTGHNKTCNISRTCRKVVNLLLGANRTILTKRM
jgi:hypothetical protein